MDISEQIAEREEREQQRRQLAILDDADFKSVTDTAAGRRFIKRILAESGVNRGSYSPDSNITAYNEGRRAIGLWVLTLFDDQERYIKTLQEKNHDTGND